MKNDKTLIKGVKQNQLIRLVSDQTLFHKIPLSCHFHSSNFYLASHQPGSHVCFSFLCGTCYCPITASAVEILCIHQAVEM